MLWLQVQPNTGNSIVNWSVIGASLTLIVTVAAKWLVPALLKLGQSGKDNEDTENFRELRIALASLATGQSTMLELLRQRTELFERQEEILDNMSKVLNELESRSRGQDEDIRRVLWEKHLRDERP